MLSVCCRVFSGVLGVLSECFRGVGVMSKHEWGGVVGRGRGGVGCAGRYALLVFVGT